MEFWAWTLLIISFFLASLGTLIPALPGLVFVLIAAIIHKQMLPEVLSWGTIVLIGLLCVLSWLLDLFSGIYGAKIGGATKYGLIGASLGGFLGLAAGLPGLILGPFFGAILGDLYAKRSDITQLFKSGTGAALGFFISLIGRFILIGLAAIVITLATIIK